MGGRAGGDECADVWGVKFTDTFADAVWVVFGDDIMAGVIVMWGGIKWGGDKIPSP